MVSMDVEQILNHTDAIQSGHFLLASKRHSKNYVQCQKVLMRPAISMRLASALLQSIGNLSAIDAVIAPAIGGINWQVYLACELAKFNQSVLGLFAEKALVDNETQFILRRGQEIQPNLRVLIAEDVVTTGQSVLKVIDLVRRHLAIPVGVASIIDRSSSEIDFGVPLYSLLKLQIESYEAYDCQLCQQNIPLEKPGSSV